MQWIGCTDFLSLPSRDGTPPIYVKGRPYFVSKENPSNHLPHLHCSRSRSWEASHSSTCAWACLCRWRAPCEHKHLSSAQALQASSPSLRSWGLRKLRSGHPLPKPREPSPAAGRRATRRPTPSDSTLGSSAQSIILMTNATPKPHPPKRKPLPTRRIRLKGVQWGSFGKPRNARL